MIVGYMIAGCVGFILGIVVFAQASGWPDLRSRHRQRATDAESAYATVPAREPAAAPSAPAAPVAALAAPTVGTPDIAEEIVAMLGRIDRSVNAAALCSNAQAIEKMRKMVSAMACRGGTLHVDVNDYSACCRSCRVSVQAVEEIILPAVSRAYAFDREAAMDALGLTEDGLDRAAAFVLAAEQACTAIRCVDSDRSQLEALPAQSSVQLLRAGRLYDISDMDSDIVYPLMAEACRRARNRYMAQLRAMEVPAEMRGVLDRLRTAEGKPEARS